MGYYKEKAIEETISIKTLTCPFCNKPPEEYVVKIEQLNKYSEGALIQDAFPELSAVERERLISGTCGECWDKYMK